MERLNTVEITIHVKYNKMCIKSEASEYCATQIFRKATVIG